MSKAKYWIISILMAAMMSIFCVQATDPDPYYKTFHEDPIVTYIEDDEGNRYEIGWCWYY